MQRYLFLLLLLAALSSSCQKTETEAGTTKPERLCQAARQQPNLHPYLRDYLLGDCPIAIPPVLREALREWRAETEDPELQRAIDWAIRDLPEPLSAESAVANGVEP